MTAKIVSDKIQIDQCSDPREGRMGRRIYAGYPLDRIVSGIGRIWRRDRARVSPRGKLDGPNEAIRYYLMSFGFDDPDDFAAHLAARTSPTFAARLLAGTLPGRMAS